MAEKLRCKLFGHRWIWRFPQKDPNLWACKRGCGEARGTAAWCGTGSYSYSPPSKKLTL